MVEILTVIVLLGILSALVLPRLAGQTDKARAAEATHMLGAIRQAEEAYKSGPAGVYLPIQTDTALGLTVICGNDPANPWIALGLGDPNGPNAFYSYCVDSVNGNQTFRAIARRIRNSAADPVQEITLNQDGIWSGNSPYVPDNRNNCTCGSSGCPPPC